MAIATRNGHATIRSPGMLHGHVIRPPAIGATVLAEDEPSLRGIPNVRVVWRESFLGVVASDEWAAVRTARVLELNPKLARAWVAWLLFLCAHPCAHLSPHGLRSHPRSRWRARVRCHYPCSSLLSQPSPHHQGLRKLPNACTG
jgi:hypothetical protein